MMKVLTVPNGGLHTARRRSKCVLPARNRQVAPRARDPDERFVRLESSSLERQEERFLRALTDLESIVSGDHVFDHDDEDVAPVVPGVNGTNTSNTSNAEVEALASLLEGGEELPVRLDAIEYHREPLQSFLERLESGLRVFRDVVEGRRKVGHILPRRPEEDNEQQRTLSSFLTDIPEDTSTYAPDIPANELAKYTFGERVMYVLRRGYKSGTVYGPISLLDKYGLLDDEFTLESPLCETRRGTASVMRYCAALDREATQVRCCNLLVAFPQLRNPVKFRDGPEPPIARATCDVMIFVPVPKEYRSYLASRGEGYNTRSIRSQVKSGIDLTGGDTETITIIANGMSKGSFDASLRPLVCSGAEMLQNIWLTYPEQRAVEDDGEKEADKDPNDDFLDLQTATVTEKTTMTPDEAEAILRTLLGDNFDAIAQQLPKKRTTPQHIDPEYETMFDESAWSENELRLATTWEFEVDLVGRLVRHVNVDLSWVNLGRVHERDLVSLLKFLTTDDD